MNSEYKKCSYCKVEKPLSDFHADRTKSDGKACRCKKCRKLKRGHYNNTRTKIKYPKPRRRTTVEFDFLQYIRLVYRWTTDNYELTRGQIDMLLYLYPKGTFKKTEFYEYQKTIHMLQKKAFDFFLDKGWIKMWRKRSGNESALYVLTSKAKSLCYRMHAFCVGKEKISTNPRFNKMIGKDKPRINNYYLKMIDKMNSERGD